MSSPDSKNFLSIPGFSRFVTILKWHLDPSSRLATINMDRKVEVMLCPFRGRGQKELGPHLTQYNLGQGLPPYQVASWSIQPFGHNTHGLKSVGVAVPLSRGQLGPHSNTMWRGLRPTSILRGILIHSTIWPQYTNITDWADKTDRQTMVW